MNINFFFLLLFQILHLIPNFYCLCYLKLSFLKRFFFVFYKVNIIPFVIIIIFLSLFTFLSSSLVLLTFIFNSLSIIFFILLTSSSGSSYNFLMNFWLFWNLSSFYTILNDSAIIFFISSFNLLYLIAISINSITFIELLIFINILFYINKI